MKINNIFAYIQGNIRYHLYYSKHFKFLIRKHIREQIEYRINSMNRECYSNGSCIKCGCSTTHLQMADKKCEGSCYPIMISNKGVWEFWKKSKITVEILIDSEYIWKLDTKNKKFIKDE